MKLEDTLFVTKLHDSGIQLTEADVAAFEQELAARLPSEYREFLLLRNGGAFYEPLVWPLVKNEYSEEFGLTVVFRLLELPDDNTNDLRANLQTHQGRIPHNTLPIGDDGDNLLLIDLRPEAEGALYLWIRDNELIKDVEENRIPAATSFLDMASRCRVSPDYFSNRATTPPFRAIEHFDIAQLRCLLDAGLDVNATDEHGVPLIVAACNELNYDAAALLLARGANPNRPDRRGSSALKSAAGQGARDLVKLLLGHGAFRHLPNDPSASVLNSLYPPPRRRMRELLSGNRDNAQ
jgi:hypothetical protein